MPSCRVTCVALDPRRWLAQDGNKSVKVNFLWSSCSESEGQGGMEVMSDGSYLKWTNLRTFEETQSLSPTWFCVHPVLSAENITRMCSPSVRGGTTSLILVTSLHIRGFIDLTQTRTRSCWIRFVRSLNPWECFAFSGTCFVACFSDKVV